MMLPMQCHLVAWPMHPMPLLSPLDVPSGSPHVCLLPMRCLQPPIRSRHHPDRKQDGGLGPGTRVASGGHPGMPQPFTPG